MNYLIKVGDALSQLANVVFLNGHPNESLSGRAHRTNSRWEKVIDFFLGKNHCKVAYYNDLLYATELIKNKIDFKKE